MATVLLVGGLSLVALLMRSSDDAGTSADAVPTTGQVAESGGMPSAPSSQVPVPTPEAPASREPFPSNPGTGAGGSEGTPGGPGGEGPGSEPPAPPPQPPPSLPVRPTPIPCNVSISAGPVPGAPNIRIVVTAAPNVEVLWATVTEGSRSLRGAIALTGGRGEQIVDGVSQGARVTVFSDASMAEPTLSCSANVN
jgi:hypothetical protein